MFQAFSKKVNYQSLEFQFDHPVEYQGMGINLFGLRESGEVMYDHWPWSRGNHFSSTRQRERNPKVNVQNSNFSFHKTCIYYTGCLTLIEEFVESIFHLKNFFHLKTPESNLTRWGTWVGSRGHVSPFLRMKSKMVPV